MIKCNKRRGGWHYQKFETLQQHCVPDVTLETQGHVGTALYGLFARNTVVRWVVNNVHVPNAPSGVRDDYRSGSRCYHRAEFDRLVLR